MYKRQAFTPPASASAPPASGGGNSEGLRVIDAQGGPFGSLAGPFDLDALLCAGDSWWCAWSLEGGVSLVDSHGAVRTLEMQRGEPPGTLRSSPDGSRLFTARALPALHGSSPFATDAMRLWVPPAGTPIAAVATGGDFVESVAFSPDGRRMALGRHRDRVATLHATSPVELATEVPRWTRGAGYRYPPALTADGREMVTYADERTLRVWRDDGTERAHWSVVPLGQASRWLSLHPTRRTVLVTGPGGEVVEYDLDGRERRRWGPTPPADRALWIGAEGRFLTTAGPRVRFHDPEGNVAAEVEGTVIAHDPSRGAGDEVPVATPSGEVRIYDSRGEVRRTLDAAAGGESAWYEGCPAGTAVSVEGLREGHVAASGGLGTCRYLDSAGRVLWAVPVGGFGVRQASISPDGTRVAIVASGGLDLRDGAGRAVASPRIEGGIASLAFDGTGTLLAAASIRGTVRVWDRDGRVRFDLPDASGPSYVNFSPDGRRVATVTPAMARLFTTDPAELEALAARRSPRDLTVVERARFADILERSP